MGKRRLCDFTQPTAGYCVKRPLPSPRMSRAFLTCCDAKFLPGAKSLLERVRAFHPEVRRYCFVPGVDLPAARLALGDLATLMPPPGRVEGVPDEYQIYVARLFMGRLEEDVVVYVDADAVLCGPIGELWEVQDNRLYAVHDLARMVLTMVPKDLQPIFSRQFPEIAPAPGFNSGVLALRPEHWRAMPEEFSAALLAGKYPRYHPLFDQPLLNGLYGQRVRWLDAKFNVNNLWEARMPEDVRIIHFTGEVKPWMPAFPKHATHYYYWVKYGLNEQRQSRLMLTRLRIMAGFPRRLVGRFIHRPPDNDWVTFRTQS